MSLTNTFETRVLTWLLTTAAATRPTAWYLGLSSTAPNDDGTGVTPPAGGYARVPVTFTVTGNVAANNAVIEFPEATADWGDMTHGTVYDALTGGNLIAYGPLRDSGGVESPVNVGTGQIVRIPTGAFTISAD